MASEHSRAARDIKKELIVAFPETVFQVRSKTRVWGDFVIIFWENGPTKEAVMQIAGKYQQRDNGSSDLPKVKDVFAERETN